VIFCFSCSSSRPPPPHGLVEYITSGLIGSPSLASCACLIPGISEQLTDKPIGVEILGEKVVLFRDAQGKVVCLQDVCPHRGAPLHKGYAAATTHSAKLV